MTDGRAGRLRELGESIGNALMERAGRVAARVQERRKLGADLLESDDTYRVVFDAPGATGSDVQVRFVDGGVSVRVDRFRDFHEGFEMRFPGRGLSLDGRVELPAEARVDPDSATATLTDHGTLEVDVPKQDDAPDRTTVDEERDAEDVEPVETTDDEQGSTHSE